jgi:hypothetical protein
VRSAARLRRRARIFLDRRFSLPFNRCADSWCWCLGYLTPPLQSAKVGSQRLLQPARQTAWRAFLLGPRDTSLLDPVIAYVDLVDGTRRPVFEQLDGRQYVLDEDERVFGVWHIPPDGGVDLPVIVPA